MVTLCAFGLGIIVGLATNGVRITVNHKESKPEKVEYNESLANYLPPEVQQYYQSTQGANKF